MLSRVQMGAVHSQLMEAKKQRLQQQQQQQQQKEQQQQQERQQQQRNRDMRLQEAQPPPQLGSYDVEADIAAQLAGVSSRRQQQQQQPRQVSGTSRSSSSGHASGVRAAAAGGRLQQQQQRGCDDSSGRDTLLQLLAVGEALFKAEEGCTSDEQADVQVCLQASAAKGGKTAACLSPSCCLSCHV
jgi:hypothetical protein